MANNPVVWFEIYVEDMGRARKFYESVLGVTLEKLEGPDPSVEMFSFPMQENGAGAAGALVRMAGGPGPGGGTVVYFHCADCAVEAGRVVASGGQLIKDKFSIGEHGHIALASDSEGNMIGFHSPQ